MDKRGATTGTGSTCEQEWRSGAKHATTLLLVSLFPSSSPSTATTPRILASNHPPKLAQLCPNDAHDLYLSNSSHFIHIEKAKRTSNRQDVFHFICHRAGSVDARPARTRSEWPERKFDELDGYLGFGRKECVDGICGWNIEQLVDLGY